MAFFLRVGIAFGILTIACGQNAHAIVRNITTANNWDLLLNNPNFLNPGDEMVFAAGTYSTTRRISIGYLGTAANPITIRAAEGANVIITRPDAGQNVLNFEGAQHVNFEGFEVTGGSAGMRFSDRSGVQSKFVTIKDNHIHHVGNVAIAANINGKTYEGMHFVGNEIHHTSAAGEGFYLGCNNNACQFYDSIIEKNYIHDLDGPSISQGDGIEIKDGSYNNIIRDNVIHDTNFPGILVYGVEEQGGRNIIERNVIWNSGDHAIQAAADATIRNNLIFSSTFDGIHSQNHQGAIPGNLTIANNTISTSGNAIDVGFPSGGALSGDIDIANNALYSNGNFALDLASIAGAFDYNISSNVGIGNTNGSLTTGEFDNSGNLINDFINFVGKDAFPKPGSALIGAADAAYLPADDFNLSTRGASLDVGAYLYAASGNPGWQVASAFKEFLTGSGQPGDYNGDGMVDAADYTLWRDGGSPDSSSAGYDLWVANYGAGTSNSESASVPEPGTLLMLSLCSAMLLVARPKLSETA